VMARMIKHMIRWEKRTLLREIEVKLEISRKNNEMKREFESAVQKVPSSKFRTPIDFDLTRGLFGFFDGSKIMVLARPSVKFGLDLLHFASTYRFHGRIVTENCADKYLVGEIRLVPWVREFVLLFVNMTIVFLVIGILFGTYEFIVLENMNALFVLPLISVISILNLCGAYLMCRWFAFRSRRAREQINELLTAITGSDASITSLPRQ